MRTLITVPWSIGVGVLAIRKALDDAGDALGGIVLHVAHIGADGVKPERLHHVSQLLHALQVGRDLRLEVVDVLRDVANGKGRAGQEGDEIILAKGAFIDELEIVDIDPLLHDGRRLR